MVFAGRLGWRVATEMKSYACVEVEVSQVRDTQSSFLVARGTRCRIP